MNGLFCVLMIVVDVETTGIDPKKHSLVSIGAVDFCNPANQFYEECRIWDGAEIMQPHGEYGNPLDINGFTEQQIKDPNKKSLKQVIQEFLEWAETCKNKTIAGHNPWMDLCFIQDSAERYGLVNSFGKRTIDLHTVCYVHYLKRGIEPPLNKKRTSINADHVFVYTGICPEPKPHIAINGAKWEAEAFSRLIYGKSLLKEFEEYPVPSYLLG